MASSAPEGLSADNAPFAARISRPRSTSDKTALALEKIRPELNLEKWAIWHPAKSKNAPAERVIRRDITLPSGNKISATVEVGFTNKGALTTEDQKAYYALIKHWEERGRASQQTFFSLRHLAKRLKKKWGSNVIESLTRSLLRLRTVPFVWTNAYFDATMKDTIETLDTFSILSELRIITRKADGVVNKEFGYFRFNDFILKNLLTNHTKPILLDVVLNFKSEVAQILYTYLDLILADKTLYERRTRELFDDLFITGKEYRKRSVRKRILERALLELSGAPVTTGRITSATLEETKDRKDYKIVIRKGARQTAIEAGPELADESRGEDQPSEPAPKQQITIQAEELARYFHKIFHGVDQEYTSSKEVTHAVTLIAQHGLEKAKYAVDFAKRVAPETNYKPQSFGGILHYTWRALAEYEQNHRAKASADALAACSLCDTSGYRTVKRVDPNTGHESEAAKPCTHDPVAEAQFDDKLRAEAQQRRRYDQARDDALTSAPLSQELRPQEDEHE